MKRLIATTILVSFTLTNSYGHEGFKLNITELENKLLKLKEMHALECSPEEVGKVESYLESLKQDIEREKNEKETVYILKPKQKTDIDYTLTIKNLLTKIEKNIYSDKDKDGIPCYKEIELGLDPNKPDKKEEKIVINYGEENKTENINPSQTEKEIKSSSNPIVQPVRVHFYTNRADIKKEYLPYLNIVAKYLKTHPDTKVKIVGYTDNVGSKTYNNKLALERAKNVKKYLTKLGVNPDRIVIEGIGKDKYIVSNNNQIDKFTNRRAEFYVINLAE
ncbi:OmpA family protein [Sulfurihydrogenibium sp.]|uniref:OmpA family protein n=1 Tax=Sulfurihydrogenibium sp. TaxID=2053621 RepID=UPI00262BC21B|nr:OmpA family protein [Sulfurihydrogenibium sp.]